MRPRPVLRPVPRFTSALALLAVALVTTVGCQGGPNGDYVGTWRSAGADSLGMRYSLRADGTTRILERPPTGEARAYDARYDILGDSVLTLSDDLDDARFRVRLDGDTLHLENPATGVRTVWVRL